MSLVLMLKNAEVCPRERESRRSVVRNFTAALAHRRLASSAEAGGIDSPCTLR
eukprot:TRINITY_DN89_c0_g1_i1.p2 TRINITY_DN89_c0_g1~~TRINITY_DN89_c0_g1_i1.p2  ORF type:complete len:53 (+),score=16.61 TRINITY_DN89_c0_g1_i1:55-213(+)